MNFKKPKVFKKQNNSWNGYLRLSDIWGDEI